MKSIGTLLLCSVLLATADASADVDVVMQTDLGEIHIRVFDEQAPVSAASFLAHVDGGLYAGGGFYRTVSPANDNGTPVISVIQGGLLEDTDALPAVAHETTEETGIRHTDGIVSLARGEPGTGSGAAFFICIGDQPSLDAGGTRNPDRQGFAAFAKVMAGMDVVHAIHASDANGASDSAYTEGQILTEPVRILDARRVPRGD